jgi:hypothetical protein
MKYYMRALEAEIPLVFCNKGYTFDDPSVEELV